MAFPTVASTPVASTYPWGTSAASPTMPSGIVAGDLLVAFAFQSGTVVSAPEGWTTLDAPAVYVGAGYAMHAWGRIAPADGALANVMTISRAGGNADMVVGVYRINNWAGVSLSNVKGSVGYVLSNANPPAVTAPWGADDNLWLAAAGSSAGALVVPTDYNNSALTFSLGAPLQGLAGTRQRNIDTEDPPNFVGPSSYGFGATVVVRPAVPPLAHTGTVPTINGEKNTAQPAQSPSIASRFSGGTTPYTYSLQSGTLQAGLSLNVATGAIVGTPTATGTQAIVIRATDAAAATADTNSFNVVVAADTTPPTLTSPTAAQSGTGTAAGSVSTNDATGTLYRLASTNATESAATVKAAALSQAVSSTGSQAASFTGLSAGTYYAHFVHTDPDGNDSARVSSSSFAITDDVVPPSWGAVTLAQSLVTTSSFTVTASGVATDNVAVTGYETSFDGGTSYTPNSPVDSLSRAYTGGTPGSTVNVRMRAYDAIGNRSPALSLAVVLTNTTITLGPFASNGTVWPSGTAIHISWLPAGRIGDAPGFANAVQRTATLGSGGTVAVASLPLGAGIALVSKRVTGATDDEVCYQPGTVV